MAAVLDLTVPEAGSDGKAVVVQAFEDVDDLSLYGIGVANNGGGTDGQEYTFPAVPLDSGEVLWVIRSEAAYFNYFGAEMTNWVVDDGGSISQNGDDAIELFYDGTVVDLFGDPDTDGTGEAWEYLDAWAFRNCETRTPSTNFTLTDWTIAAPNCTDGSTTNADATCPFPTADLACAPAFECDLTHVQAYLQDSFGDGWNGNVLDIAGGLVQLTLNNVDDDGAAAMFDLCLPDGYHPVTCGGGSWQAEVSWSLVNATSGETMLAGGAPFEGFLQVGEVTEVPGCTDPLAYGYDPDATVDDGSCYYDGDSCEVSLTAVEGEAGNAATGAEQWFSYTATMTGTMIATTCYPDQAEDTDVDVFVGASCDVATAVGSSDDAGCGDVTGGNNYASEIEFDCVAGETYHFFWDDTWSPGPFTWYLYESPPPTNPQNLVAMGGIEAAMLTWEGVPNPMSTSEINFNTYSNDQVDSELEYYNQKKQMLHPEMEEIHASGWVSPDYVGNTRQVVTIECDGGDWQGEVSWEILDATGAVVATGGAPAGTIDENGNYVPLTADLDGTYTLMAYDSYGDGWNGNVFTVSNETTTFLSWTLESR